MRGMRGIAAHAAHPPHAPSSMRFPLVSSWLRRVALRTVRRFEVRLERFKLVDRRIIREQLLRDPAVVEAMEAHARQQGSRPAEVRVRVEEYVDEILPFFNVLSYYRLGYNLARVVLNALYRVSSEYQDRESLDAIPRNDLVVYLM